MSETQREATTKTRGETMDCPSSPEHHHSDLELYNIVVPNLTIRRNVSKSMENMCRYQMHRTAGVSRSHSHRSLPSILVDLCDCDIESGEPKGKANHEDMTIGKEEQEGLISSVDKSSRLFPALNQKEERVEGASTRLKAPDAAGACGRDKLHYDYVRASMIFQRISNLKRHKESSNSETLSDDFDSDSGYVIEYQGEEKEPIQDQETTSDIPDTLQNEYVQLIGTNQGTNEPKSCSSHSGFDQAGTPRPPLHLSEHPNIAESDDDSVVDDDYEELVIYEELDDRETDDYREPHYDSIHQMRERTTRLVHGRHRKKLKKFIVKRKSSKMLTAGETKCGSLSDDCSVPGTTTVESDSDSSEEEEHVKLIKKLEKVSDNISETRAITFPKKTEKHGVLQRSHTCKTQSQHKSELLDSVQYDQMMKVMLHNHDVKQLQDAGAVKIKDISELRAEIKQLVQNAPSIPPPLPGYGRPGHCKTEDKRHQKKWSSKSLHK